MPDEARNALGGYLYQIVAGAGLAARAIEVSDNERGELLYTLIIEARNARVLHEVHGEDLMIRRQNAADNIERFCLKASRRRPTLQGERVRRALIRIARSFPLIRPWSAARRTGSRTRRS